MIGVLETLTPTIIFIIFAVSTVPLLSIIRKKMSFHHRETFVALWILFPFLLASLSLLRLSTEYYSNAKEQPFLNVSQFSLGVTPVSSAFLVDAVSVYMATVYLTVGFICCLYGVLYVNNRERLSERYYALMLMITGSVLAATFAGDLFTLFVFWEAATGGSCFLIVFRKKPESLEACLKYLVMIILASGFIVYGLSIVYGLAGSLNFWAVREALLAQEDKRLLVIAFSFIAAGYAIETAVVPFHMWLPDAYTAAPASSSAFLSAVVDQASYYILVRVLIYILTPPVIVNWTFTLAFFSALTMTIGNLFALAQRNLRRLISYVCVADIGYNLVAITSVTPLGVMGNLYFFLVGGMTTALSFMVIGILNNQGLKTLEDLSGMGWKTPLTSLALIIAALSFSGMPSLAGFMAKYMVFTAAMEGGMAWLAVTGVLNSVLQTAYFLRLIHYMYAKSPRKTVKDAGSRKLLIPVYLLVTAIVILGVYPTLALGLISPAANQMKLLKP